MNLLSLDSFQMLVFAQEAVENTEKAPGFFDVFGVPLAMMVMLYVFFVIMPQGRERRTRNDFLNQLKKNDQVVTYGGIFGTITGFSADGEQVTLRVDDNSRLRVRKSSIEAIVKSEGDEKSEEKSAK